MRDPIPAGTAPSVAGVVSSPSPFAGDATLGRLKSCVERHHLTLFAQIAHRDEAQRVGLTRPEAHLLIFGSPQAGTPLMIASPLLARALPLKALVWQDPAGPVWVSYVSSA
jgi:uncharacterized protein (DUF302 family)